MAVLRADLDNYPVLYVPDEVRWRLEPVFATGAPGPKWVTPNATVYPEPDAGVYPDPGAELSDYPPLASVGPCFSEHAVEVLHRYLTANGTLFPVKSGDKRFFAYRVDTTLPALDEYQSEFERFPSGEIFLIRKHVFLPDILQNASIFCLPAIRRSTIYVTGQFREAVVDHALTGFKFFPVWDGVRPVLGSGYAGVGW